MSKVKEEKISSTRGLYAMKIPEHDSFEAFTIIVDINKFTKMVSKSDGFMIAQFTRDVLAGSITAIETASGDVVEFMGDAILGLLPTAEAAASACFGIAHDLNKLCEYMDLNNNSGSWHYAEGGPSLKISVEYGSLDVSTITSNFLGTHKLFIGDTINYAARISKAGSGNRCIIGPNAAEHGFSSYTLNGPFYIKGKPGEGKYEYYFLDMSDIWIEGKKKKGHPYLD